MDFKNNQFYQYDYFGYIKEPAKSTEFLLSIVDNAIQDVNNNESNLEYLYSISPSEKVKELITKIQSNNKKHNKLLNEMHILYSKKPNDSRSNNNKPTILTCFQKAKFRELELANKYRNYIVSIPDDYFKCIIYEIFTDRLTHVMIYEDIIKLCNKNEIRQPKTSFTIDEASKIAKSLGIDFTKEKFDLNQFKTGLDVELEHGTINPTTNVTNDDPILTGKIALAHLNELPDYYVQLSKLEITK
jgi:rubrerythrin